MGPAKIITSQCTYHNISPYIYNNSRNSACFNLRMDKRLPKHLVLTLDSLIDDSMLTSWTIQANSNITSVTIRFKMVIDHNDVGSKQDTFAKYKRVPPSQIERDRVRSQQWNNSPQTNDLKSIDPFIENNSIVPFDGTIPKQTNSVPPSKSNTHSNTKAKQQAGSSVTTRSRSRL